MNFPHEDTFPYPFQDDIFPDEDGVGYALRMADANALTFHQVAAALASPGHCYLPHKSAPALAFMFGGTPKLIARAFVRRHFADGITVADYLDHRFSRPRHLRQTRPQICPLCLLEDRRALASWSLTMMCCCTKHNICLVDQCACGRPILWRRRSLLTCECGQALSGLAGKAYPALMGATSICTHIECLLGQEHFRLVSSTGNSLGAFDDVTLDTFLRLIWMIGNVDDDLARCKPRSLDAFPTSGTIMQIANNAFHRIETLLVEQRRMRHCSWLHHLNSIADDAITLTDRRMLRSMYERLCPHATTTRGRRRDSPLQFPLFQE